MVATAAAAVALCCIDGSSNNSINNNSSKPGVFLHILESIYKVQSFVYERGSVD